MSDVQTGVTVEQTVDGHFRFWGEISAQDFAKMHLDPVDRQVLIGPQTPADLLLALEMLFRRMAEQGIIGPKVPT